MSCEKCDGKGMLLGLDEDAAPRPDGATPVKAKRCTACVDQHNERPAFGVYCRICKEVPLYCDLCKGSWCVTCNESHSETAQRLEVEPPLLPEGVQPLVKPKPPRLPALAHVAAVMATFPRYHPPPPKDRAALIPPRKRTEQERAERRERKRKNKRRRARRRGR